MTDEAHKFINRAPRYSLRPGDDQFFRYAFEGDREHTFTTRFVNISMSGLAFISDHENSPALGDRIKVEFPLNTGEHVAWWARVTRVEEVPKKKFVPPEDLNKPPEVRIAVTFDNLPEGHHQAIKESVQTKFAEISRRRREEQIQQLFDFLDENGTRLFIGITAFLVTATLLWWLAQPSDHYDPNKGTFWGKRFDPPKPSK